MAHRLMTLRQLGGLMLPGAVLLLAVTAVLAEEAVRGAAAPYALVFCYGAFAAALLLSWYFDQSRFLCGTAAAVLTFWVVGRLPDAPPAGRLAAVLLLPLNFILFASVRERGVVTFEGALKVGAVLLQAAAVVWAGGTVPDRLAADVVRGGGVAWLPSPVLLVFVAAAVVLLLLFVVRRTTLEPGFFWALTAMFLGLGQTGRPEALFLYAGTAGMVLVIAVLEHGYDIAYRDELTGLAGRRAFNRTMGQLGGAYSLAMCDVDQFKTLNDTYGHDTGDQILRMVAAKLSQVGGGGRAFRYGGEEFLLVFRGLSATEAEPFVESVRTAVATAGFVVRGADRPATKPARIPRDPQKICNRIAITISAGVAGRSRRHSSPELVLDAADAALYRAKESGRNCVKLADGTPG
jgi:diguanylate cyclase (GGDEF)-like protein